MHSNNDGDLVGIWSLYMILYLETWWGGGYLNSRIPFIRPSLNKLSTFTKQLGLEDQKRAISPVTTRWQCIVTFSHSLVYPKFWWSDLALVPIRPNKQGSTVLPYLLTALIMDEEFIILSAFYIWYKMLSTRTAIPYHQWWRMVTFFFIKIRQLK